MIIFLTLNSSIRCSWPLPPSYVLLPLVPMSLHSCFFLLFFFVFLCQLFLLYLIIKWWSSGFWSTCIFCFCPSLKLSVSPGKLIQSHKVQVSTSLKIFFYFPDQLLQACPPGCPTSHHLHFQTWFSSRFPYYSECTISTCPPTK